MKNLLFLLMTTSAISFATPGIGMDEPPRDNLKGKYEGDAEQGTPKKPRHEETKEQATNQNNEEQEFILTRKDQGTELEPKSIFVSSDVLKKIATFLHFQDLVSLERTNKFTAKSLRNAVQYQMLVEGWATNPSKSFKDNFIGLMRSNMEYPVHFANLWRNYFPSVGKEKPFLTHYWKQYLSRSHPCLLSIYSSYVGALFSQPKWKNKALIGKASLHDNHLENRTNLTKALTDKRSLFGTDEAQVQYALAVMDLLGQALHGGPNLVAARNGLTAVVTNLPADPATQAKAQYALAVMNLLGQALQGGPDLVAARDGLTGVVTNLQADPATRAQAQF